MKQVVAASFERIVSFFTGEPRDAELDPITVKAAGHWDRQVSETSVYWTAPPDIAEYVNESISGVPWLSPTQALKSLVAYRPFKRGLSIGCGGGELERDLYWQRICETIEAFDVSRESLRKARANARAECMRGIRYFRADFNTVELPAQRYDMVFFHGSLHHVTDPDRLLAQVEKSLKPGGLLYVDEYVGPSRDEWTDDDLASAREEFAKLDEELKVQPVNPPVVMDDPSEMIRSSRIRGAIEERFDVRHFRPYWGNLLHPLFCALKGQAMLRVERRPLVRSLIAREKELVADGTFVNPLYAVILAAKRGT